MQITSLEPPTNGGTLYVGEAVSKRGRRYMFHATFSGEAGGVFREHPTDVLPDGRTYWHQIKAPAALAATVRRAVRKARRST